jgi:hypothetical protein
MRRRPRASQGTDSCRRKVKRVLLSGSSVSVGACPGCGLIAIGLGAAGASIAGPVYALARMRGETTA